MPLRIDSDNHSAEKSKNVGRQPVLWVLAGLVGMILFVWPFLTPGDRWAGFALYGYLTIVWLAAIVALFLIGRNLMHSSDSESEKN